MKIFKFGLILTLFTLFIFACSQNATTGNSNTATGGNANVTANSGTVIVGNSSAAFSNSANDQTGGDNELASAAKIYSEKCVKCHKEDGTGGVTDIEGTRIKAPNLTSDKHKNDKDSDWIATIKNGAKEDGMPAFKDKISDDDIKNLVKYIRKSFQGT